MYFNIVIVYFVLLPLQENASLTLVTNSC